MIKSLHWIPQRPPQECISLRTDAVDHGAGFVVRRAVCCAFVQHFLLSSAADRSLRCAYRPS